MPSKKELLNRFIPFWSAVRATPVLIPFAGVVMMLLSPSVMAGGLTVGAFISLILNHILKFLFKAGHYELTGNYKGMSLLGHGPRPAGSKGTGSFLEYPSLKPGTSWGMPSGHSQLAWYGFGFLVGYLFLWRPYSFTAIHKVVATFIALLFAVVVSFSRVWVEGVHTWDQVLVGGVFGFVIGLATVYITKFIAKKYWNEQFQNETVDMDAPNEKSVEMAKEAEKAKAESEQALEAAKKAAAKFDIGDSSNTKMTEPESTLSAMNNGKNAMNTATTKAM